VNRAVNTSVRVFSQTFEPSGPVVELGSFYVAGWEHTADLRPYFPRREYIGCDIRQGPGVDRIENAERLSFADRSVGTVIMCELLPHLPHPDRAITEAWRVLREDGLLVVSVPFDYRLNGFPSDYWRFTTAGLCTLFADFPHTSVFALGPRSKPAVVFGVAGLAAAPDFAERRARFESAIRDEFRRSRLHGRWSVAKRTGRELLGCLLGRARLGVEFFDPADGRGFWDEAAIPNPDEQR
jgi:SAM-dependent methyltransferase